MPIEKKGDFGFDRLRRGFATFRRTMPIIIAENTRNHFDEGFRKGGGQTDASAGGWPRRKPPRSKREARRDIGRAILVKRGLLRSDIKARKISYRSGIRVNTIHTAYAEAHNRGLKPQPQREFIGRSRILTAKNKLLIEKELNKLIRKSQRR